MLALHPTIKRILYGNIIILTLAAVSITAASAILFRGADIYPAITVGDIDVGLLNKKQASEKIHNYLTAKQEVPLVILTVDGDEWPLYAADLNAQYDIRHWVDNAYLVARKGHLIQRIRERCMLIQNGKTVPFQIQYDKNKLSVFADKIIAKYSKQPVNASLMLKDGQFSIQDHQAGYMISKAHLMDQIMQSIQTGWGRKVAVYADNVAPEIVTQNLQSISQEWAYFTTEFNAADYNRTENIILAARAVNGTILKPEDIFSFNDVVGLRTREKGYKDAPVYMNGRLALDAGGGVCQVSSTLYNAVLLANLEIIERTSHFRPPLYVPLGLDATVADNVLDFRFKNNTGSYLAIMSEVVDNHVDVRIFGNALKERPEVSILTTDQEVWDAQTVIMPDPGMTSGQRVVEQQEQKGYKVTTLRVVNHHGKEVRREVIARDVFTPVEEIIRVGTKTVNTSKDQAHKPDQE